LNIIVCGEKIIRRRLGLLEKDGGSKIPIKFEKKDGDIGNVIHEYHIDRGDITPCLN